MSNSEAPFSATLKMRVATGEVLLTARGDTHSDFQIRWAELAENAGDFLESLSLIAGSGAAAALSAPHTAPTPAPAPAAPDPWGTPAPAAPGIPGPACSHGPRNAVSKVGPKGPWKAWMCNAPQGSPKCDPIWINKQSPEWNTFPG